MKKLILYQMLSVVFVALMSQMLFGQALISPAGGTHSSDHISFDWSLGEIGIQHAELHHHRFSEGVLQPRLEIKSVPSDNKPLEKSAEWSNIELSIFPNPTSTHLSIVKKKDVTMDMDVQLISLNGVVSDQQIFSKNERQKSIDMAQLPAGQYFLKINGKQTNQTQTFKIIKH